MERLRLQVGLREWVVLPLAASPGAAELSVAPAKPQAVIPSELRYTQFELWVTTRVASHRDRDYDTGRFQPPLRPRRYRPIFERDSKLTDVWTTVMNQQGCIDLQVNGYAGVDFNQDDVTAEDLNFACQRLREDGVAGVLATIITDSIEAMKRRIRRIAEFRNRDELARQLILGVHIEGPFISPADGYRGAHPRDAIVPADRDLMNQLLDAADGLARIVTLAPEHDDGLAVTRMLCEQGIVASAGHCDPSLDQLDAAIDAGLSMFTHVGNGCPMTLARHDNIIQRALSRADALWLSFIADGIHVDFHALRNYLRLAGDRAIVVTDAMAAAGMGPGRYKLGRWEVEVGEDLAAWSPERAHLVGSAMTMPRARHNLVSSMGLPETRVEQLLRTAPLTLLGQHAAGPGGVRHADSGVKF